MTAAATDPAARPFSPAAAALLDVWADRFDLRRQMEEAQGDYNVAAARYDGGKADAERREECWRAVQRIDRRLSAVREVPAKLLALKADHPPDLAAALADAAGRVKKGREALREAMRRVETARADRDGAVSNLEREEKLLSDDPKFRASLPLGHSLYDSAAAADRANKTLERAEGRLAEVVLVLDEGERDERGAETAILAGFGVDRDDLLAHRERCEPVGFVSNGREYGTTVLGRTVTFNPLTPFVCDDASEVKNLRELCGPHKYLREVPPGYRAPAVDGGDGRSIWDRLGLKLPAWMGGRYRPFG